VSIDSVGGLVCVPSIPGLESKVGKRFTVGRVLLFVNFCERVLWPFSPIKADLVMGTFFVDREVVVGRAVAMHLRWMWL